MMTVSSDQHTDMHRQRLAGMAERALLAAVVDG